MKRAVISLAAVGALACSVDSGTAPTTNVISTAEKAAVQQALAISFAGDSLFASLSTFVLPFIDQATPLVNGPGDTTKLAAFQLQVSGTTLSAGLSGVLAWRGFRSATQTVDSVFLLIGGGFVPPLDDSLSADGAIDIGGSGTAWVVAQAPDSSVQTWRARTGALRVNSVNYGEGSSIVLQGLTWTRFRGTLVGNAHVTAKLVPDSTTSVSAGWDFGGGLEAMMLKISPAP
ncbi:MAG TPA: hypothetical protein VKP10_08890 [Gemmatimonadales bacterium]|nr:hypothetical protein [Gemmatimonadales bacterium]